MSPHRTLSHRILTALLLWSAACGDAEPPPRAAGRPAAGGTEPAVPSRAGSGSRASASAVSPGALGRAQSITPSDAWFFVSDRVDGVPLEGVDRLALLGSGDILAVHGRGSELLLLDPDGSLRRRIGRGSDGGADFAAVRDVFPCSDSLVVAIGGDGVLKWFGADGEFVEATSIAESSEGPLRVVGADRGCAAFLLEKLSPPSSLAPGTTAFGRRSLLRFDRAGARLEPIEISSRWVGSFAAETPGEPVPMEAPFALGDDVAFGLDGSVFVISHDRGELVLHRPPEYAAMDTVRWSTVDVPERLASWEDLFERPFTAARERSPELRALPSAERFPEPAALPKSDRILVGQDGTIFVRLGQGRDRLFFFVEADRPALPRERWIAFSPEGDLVGHYLLPRAHRLVGGGPGRELFVVGTDETGLPLAYWVPSEPGF